MYTPSLQVQRPFDQLQDKDFTWILEAFSITEALCCLDSMNIKVRHCKPQQCGWTFFINKGSELKILHLLNNCLFYLPKILILPLFVKNLLSEDEKKIHNWDVGTVGRSYKAVNN